MFSKKHKREGPKKMSAWGKLHASVRRHAQLLEKAASEIDEQGISVDRHTRWEYHKTMIGMTLEKGEIISSTERKRIYSMLESQVSSGFPKGGEKK